MRWNQDGDRQAAFPEFNISNGIRMQGLSSWLLSSISRQKTELRDLEWNDNARKKVVRYWERNKGRQKEDGSEKKRKGGKGVAMR
jgi:hypothetical protein